MPHNAASMDQNVVICVDETVDNNATSQQRQHIPSSQGLMLPPVPALLFRLSTPMHELLPRHSLSTVRSSSNPSASISLTVKPENASSPSLPLGSPDTLPALGSAPSPPFRLSRFLEEDVTLTIPAKFPLPGLMGGEGEDEFPSTVQMESGPPPAPNDLVNSSNNNSNNNNCSNEYGPAAQGGIPPEPHNQQASSSFSSFLPRDIDDDLVDVYPAPQALTQTGADAEFSRTPPSKSSKDIPTTPPSKTKNPSRFRQFFSGPSPARGKNSRSRNAQTPGPCGLSSPRRSVSSGSKSETHLPVTSRSHSNLPRTSRVSPSPRGSRVHSSNYPARVSPSPRVSRSPAHVSRAVQNREKWQQEASGQNMQDLPRSSSPNIRSSPKRPPNIRPQSTPHKVRHLVHGGGDSHRDLQGRLSMESAGQLVSTGSLQTTPPSATRVIHTPPGLSRNTSSHSQGTPRRRNRSQLDASHMYTRQRSNSSPQELDTSELDASARRRAEIPEMVRSPVLYKQKSSPDPHASVALPKRSGAGASNPIRSQSGPLPPLRSKTYVTSSHAGLPTLAKQSSRSKTAQAVYSVNMPHPISRSVSVPDSKSAASPQVKSKKPLKLMGLAFRSRYRSSASQTSMASGSMASVISLGSDQSSPRSMRSLPTAPPLKHKTSTGSTGSSGSTSSFLTQQLRNLTLTDQAGSGHNLQVEEDDIDDDEEEEIHVLNSPSPVNSQEQHALGVASTLLMNLAVNST
eukprot:g78111.t1